MKCCCTYIQHDKVLLDRLITFQISTASLLLITTLKPQTVEGLVKRKVMVMELIFKDECWGRNTQNVELSTEESSWTVNKMRIWLLVGLSVEVKIVTDS